MWLKGLRTIRNALIIRYLEKNNTFNLINDLKDVVYNINNIKHMTTKFKHIEIFYSNDIEFYNKIKENTINSFKNIKRELLDLKENDCILIFNNFDYTYVKKENIIYLSKLHVKTKNVLFDICGTVLSILSNNAFKILIEKDYPQYNLKKFDCCVVNCCLIKKVDLYIWLKILNKYINILFNQLENLKNFY